VPVFQRVFGADDETLGTKRLSPGLVTGWNGSAFLHDASTLPGSSGSCLVDFESRRVIGLHFKGSYRDQRNQAIPVWRLREDPMLLAQGIGFGAE
jgi:V8-like Glu-specific endopeptidase